MSESYISEKIEHSLSNGEIRQANSVMNFKIPDVHPSRDFYFEEISSDETNTIIDGFRSLDVALAIEPFQITEFPPNFFEKLKFCIDFNEDRTKYNEIERAKPLIAESMESLARQLLKTSPDVLDLIMENEIPQSVINKIPAIDPSKLLSTLLEMNIETIKSMSCPELFEFLLEKFNRVVRQPENEKVFLNTFACFLKAGSIPGEIASKIIKKAINIFKRSCGANDELKRSCFNVFIACNSEEYLPILIDFDIIGIMIPLLNNMEYNVDGLIFDVFDLIAGSPLYEKLIEMNVFYFLQSTIEAFRRRFEELSFIIPKSLSIVAQLLQHFNEEEVAKSFSESGFTGCLDFVFENVSLTKNVLPFLNLLEVMFENENLRECLESIDVQPLLTYIIESENDDSIVQLLNFLLIFEENDCSTHFLDSLANAVHDELFEVSLQELTSSTNSEVAARAETLCSRFYN